MTPDSASAPATLDDLFGRPATGPLAGIVVADLSRVLAGPYGTMLLADMGALVIKIESRAGDDTRTWAPPRRGEEATYFLSVNRNKYSIALDFSDPDDLAVVHQIIARADVLVENFKVGGLARFGLDQATLRARHPDLIYASISGFGSAGGADLPGYDLIAQAVSGMMDLTGAADGEPTKLGVALFDVVAGLHTTTAILAALHERHGSGRGEHIEVNLLSSALSALVNQSGAFVAGDVTPRRMGNAHPSLAPYEPFPARDAPLVIAVGNDAQFARLCAVVGVPDAAADPRFRTMADRNAHRAELREVLSEQLATRDADEWFEALRAESVPAAPILSVAEGIRFADSIGLQPVAVAGSGQRRIPTVRHPVSFARSPIDYSQAPPRLDADRARVLAWLAAADPAGPHSEAGDDS